MNFNQTCKIPVVLTSEPYERPWESVSKETGEKITGSASVIKGVMIPQSADSDPSTLKEIEFNISNLNSIGKSPAQIMKTYLKNEDKFKDCSAYAIVDVYMGPRTNRDGIVTFFSPYINDVQIIATSEEDMPLVKVVKERSEQL